MFFDVLSVFCWFLIVFDVIFRFFFCVLGGFFECGLMVFDVFLCFFVVFGWIIRVFDGFHVFLIFLSVF